MKLSIRVSIQILAVVTVLSLFTSACTLDDLLRALEQVCSQTTFTVTTTADTNNALCTASNCSLRAAVISSNACPGTQTIDVPAGTYTLTIAGAGEDAARTGDLDLMQDVNIVGTGNPVVDGNAADRVFDILPGVTATLDGLVIQNGRSDDGGGIRNRGSLNLRNSTVQNNVVTIPSVPSPAGGGNGGGILSEGDSSLILHIVHVLNNRSYAGGGVSVLANGTTPPRFDVVASNFNGNTAQASGGGLWLDNGVDAYLNLFDVSNNAIAEQRGAGIWNASTLGMAIGAIDNNRGGTAGGGIYNEPAGNITSQWVVFKDDTSRAGGGLYNNGQAAFSFGSFTTNTAERGQGGGIFNDSEGVLHLDDLTLSGNQAVTGGGIHNEGGTLNVTYATVAANTPDGINANGGAMTLSDSILAGALGGNCTGTLPVSAGYNLDDAHTCGFTQASDLSATDPLLQPLVLMGTAQPGYVHPLDLFSPAVNSADPATCGAQDEIAQTRPAGPRCDRGAYELPSGGPLPPPHTTVATIPAPIPIPGELSLSHAVLPADQFYSGGAGCGPLDAKFQVVVSDPAKASSVVLFFRLEDKAGNGSTPWNDGMAMQPDGQGGFSYDLTSNTIPAFNSYQNAWLVYQFAVTGPDGKVVLRSDAFKELTLSMCGKK